MKNLEISPNLEEPQPLLVRFLIKFEIDGSAARENGIYIRAKKPMGDPKEIHRRNVTLEELDQTEKWLSDHGNIGENPIVKSNMALLRDERSKIPLSSEPLV